MEDQKPSRKEKAKKIFMDNLLTILLVLSVSFALILGIIIRAVMKEPLTDRQATFLSFPGDLLIRMLKSTATPLIVTCVIGALGSLDLNISKNVGWQFFLMVFGTKAVSSSIGVVLAVLIHPGKIDDKESSDKKIVDIITVADVFLDMFRNIIPNNMIRMYIELYKTKLTPPKGEHSNDYTTWDILGEYDGHMNLLGIIFIATVIGVSLSVLREQSHGLLVVVVEVSQVSMKLVTWILWSSPVFLIFLILSEILKIEDYGTFFSTWGMLIVTIFVGYGFMFFIVYPLLLFFVARTNPLKFYWVLVRALVTAFATASSMGTMPILIECLIKDGVDERLVEFVVPIAININKDGACCFLAVSTVFMAQMTGYSLSFGQYVTILILAGMASIAAAAVPFSGVVVLVMILNGLGIEQTYAAGILTIDWINDRGATFTNILGNGVLTKILEKWNKKFLEELPEN